MKEKHKMKRPYLFLLGLIMLILGISSPNIFGVLVVTAAGIIIVLETTQEK